MTLSLEPGPIGEPGKRHRVFAGSATRGLDLHRLVSGGRKQLNGRAIGLEREGAKHP